MDIDPLEWLDRESRFKHLEEEVRPALNLLQYSECLDKVLKLWVRREVLKNQQASLDHVNSQEDKALLIQWSRDQWGHRLNELFLQKKQELDVVSFNLLRVGNQAVALELYHRLKEGESTFAELSRIYAVGPDSQKDPFKKNQRVGNLPEGIRQLIKKMNVGQLSKPMQIKSDFLLVRVEEFSPVQFSESIQEKLLIDQFASWAAQVAQISHDRLTS